MSVLTMCVNVAFSLFIRWVWKHTDAFNPFMLQSVAMTLCLVISYGVMMKTKRHTQETPWGGRHCFEFDVTLASVLTLSASVLQMFILRDMSAFQFMVMFTWTLPIMELQRCLFYKRPCSYPTIVLLLSLVGVATTIYRVEVQAHTPSTTTWGLWTVFSVVKSASHVVNEHKASRARSLWEMCFWNMLLGLPIAIGGLVVTTLNTPSSGRIISARVGVGTLMVAACIVLNLAHAYYREKTLLISIGRAVALIGVCMGGIVLEKQHVNATLLLLVFINSGLFIYHGFQMKALFSIYTHVLTFYKGKVVLARHTHGPFKGQWKGVNGRGHERTHTVSAEGLYEAAAGAFQEESGLHVTHDRLRLVGVLMHTEEVHTLFHMDIHEEELHHLMNTSETLGEVTAEGPSDTDIHPDLKTILPTLIECHTRTSELTVHSVDTQAAKGGHLAFLWKGACKGNLITSKPRTLEELHPAPQGTGRVIAWGP